MEIAANRVVIERVKGLLMFVYGVDADTAYELLRLRARSIRASLRDMSEQLVADFGALSADERSDLQSACDRLLITVHERLSKAT